MARQTSARGKASLSWLQKLTGPKTQSSTETKGDRSLQDRHHFSGHQNPKDKATHSSFLDPVKEEKTDRTTACCKRASGRQNLLIFLHTAIQYSSDSKLFLLPPQPPYIKRMHFFLYMSKYQRGITARQGPVIASWEQTAVWEMVKASAGDKHSSAKLIQQQ